jgi:hypothetical protein
MLDIDVDTIAQTLDEEFQKLLVEERLKNQEASQTPSPEDKRLKKLNDETSSTLSNISKHPSGWKKRNVPPKFGRNFWPDWEI